MKTANNLQEAMKVADLAVQQPNEIERLLATGERLLRNQQERLLNEESQYQRRRNELVDSYRVRMERLRLEAEDAFRSLDSEHEAKMAGIRSLIGKLRAMREA